MFPAVLFFAPLLAVDGGGIVTLLILLFSFIAWVVKQVQGEGGDNSPPVRRPPRPRREPRREDVDIFIQDNDKPSRQTQPQNQKRDQKRENQKRRRRPSEDEGEGPRRATVSSGNLGAGVARSVSEHIRAGAMATAVAQDVGHRVDDSVQSHLGAFNVGAAAVGTVRTGTRFRELLLNKANVRQAILLNEILSKPRALR